MTSKHQTHQDVLDERYLLTGLTQRFYSLIYTPAGLIEVEDAVDAVCVV